MTVSLNGLTQESGYATNYGSITGFPVDPSEHVGELIYPFSIQVFDRMRRGDDQIKAVSNAINLPILRAPWRIDPNGADPKIVAHVASDMNLPIVGQEDIATISRRRGAFSWQEHLRLALLHLMYGHIGFEIVCDTNRGDGLAHLDRLSPRMPVTIGRLDTDRSGRLTAAYQFPTMVPGKDGKIASAVTPDIDPDTGMVKIDAERLVWYVNELEGAAWQGNSILRNCYGMWQLKNRALKVNAFKDERNGMGVPWVENPVGQQDLAPGQQLAEKLRAGEQAGGSLPAGSQLHISGVTGTLPDIIASLNFYNEGISRVMLTQFLNLGTTKTGSRALGDSFIDFFKLALDALTANIVETATAQIIEPLVSWNYGETVATPRLQVAEVDLETDLPPDSLVALASAGILTNDEGLEKYTRDRFHLPKLEGTARPVTPPQSAFSLPGQPVTARARERRVKAKASGSKADALAEADRARTKVEAAQKALLRPAWQSMVAHADLSPVLTQLPGFVAAGAGLPTPAGLPGALLDPDGAAYTPAGDAPHAGLADRSVMAAADPASGVNWQPILTPVIQQQLAALRNTASGQRVDAVVTAGVMAGHAQGDLQAQGFLTASRTVGLTPLPPYDAASAVSGWWNNTLGATSRRLGQALSDALAEADSLDRDQLLTIAEDVLDDDVDAAFYLDDAIAWSLTAGSTDRYAAAGVQQVEFLTAEDNLVDEACDTAEQGNPYPLNGAPSPPLHPRCRCALAPL